MLAGSYLVVIALLLGVGLTQFANGRTRYTRPLVRLCKTQAFKFGQLLPDHASPLVNMQGS
jgi:hypothetical protein